MNNRFLFISLLVCSFIQSMDNPSKQAHLIPPLVHTLSILGPQFIKYTADGKHIIVGTTTTTENKLYVINTQDYKTEWNPSLSSTAENVCDVSPDSNYIVSSDGVSLLNRWSIEAQTSVALPDTQMAGFPTFSNDGQQLLYNWWQEGHETQARIYDIRQKECAKQINTGPRPPSGLGWNTINNNEVSVLSCPTGNPSQLRIWDVTANKLRELASIDDAPCDPVWNKDGTTVMMGCKGYFVECDTTKANLLTYYNLQGKKLEGKPHIENPNPEWPLELCPISGDTKRLFAATYYGNVVYCNFEANDQSFQFAPELNPAGNNMVTIDINPDQQRLAVSNYGGEGCILIRDISAITAQKKALAEVKEEVKKEIDKEQLQAKNRRWGTCKQQ